MSSQLQYINQMRQLASQLQKQDQDSSSKLTIQSCHDGGHVRQESSSDQCFSANSGKDDCGGKCDEASKNSAPSLGKTDILPAQQVDYPQSVTYLPYNYLDSYYGGVMAAYGPHAVIQPQLLTVTPPTRVPLPVDLREDEPIYVNAKQYRGILRRRQHRAKLEAQNRLLKGRKPYLHESRHLHAMRRVRASSGRFLNTKSLQEQQPQERRNGVHIADGMNNCGSSSFQFGDGGCLSESDVFQSDNMKIGSSGSTCSDITSISDTDIYQLPGTVGFPSGYHSRIGGDLPQNMVNREPRIR